MVFGIRLSIGTVGEQADNLEATAGAYQDCHKHRKLPHEQHARFSASDAVTAVTGYSSNSPLFFGRPICATPGAFLCCRRQLFANAAIAASRVGSYPCVGVR